MHQAPWRMNLLTMFSLPHTSDSHISFSITHDLASTPTLMFYVLAILRSRFHDNFLLILCVFFGGGRVVGRCGSISKRQYSVIGQSMDHGSNNLSINSSLCGTQWEISTAIL